MRRLDEFGCVSSIMKLWPVVRGSNCSAGLRWSHYLPPLSFRQGRNRERLLIHVRGLDNRLGRQSGFQRDNRASCPWRACGRGPVGLRRFRLYEQQPRWGIVSKAFAFQIIPQKMVESEIKSQLCLCQWVNFVFCRRD